MVEVYETLIDFNTPTKSGAVITHEAGEIIIIYEGLVLAQGLTEGEFELASYSPEFVRINRKLFQRKA